MSARRLIVLTAVVVVLFAFVAFFERRLPTTQQRLDQRDVLWSLKDADLHRIQIVRGSETLEFVRNADLTWRMTKPASYPADDSSLSTLVFDLAKPARVGVAPEGVAQPDYGLIAPRAVITVTTKAAKGASAETRTLSLGRDIPGTDMTAARVKGENKIFFVRQTLASDVLKPADSFKSKKIFSGSLDDMTGLSVARGRGTLEFAKKNGTWWMRKPYEDLADETSVDRLAGDLLAEDVSEFLDVAPADLAGTGLKTPIYTVSATIAGKPQTLEIGATRSDGKSVYARANGAVFALEASVTDELSKEADAYRDMHPVRFEAADVRAVSVEERGKTRRFEKSKTGMAWTEDGKPVVTSGVEDLLTAIAALTASDFAETPVRSARPAIGGFTLDLASGSRWSATVGPYRAGELAVTVSGRPQPLVVKAADYARVTQAADKIALQAGKASVKK